MIMSGRGQVTLEMNPLLPQREADQQKQNSTLGHLALALLEAITRDDTGEVENILRNNPSPELLFHWVGGSYMANPLELACKTGSKNVMSVILQCMTNKSKLGELNSGYAPFHYTAFNGNTEVLKMIMKTEVVDINLRTTNAQTALHLACRFGHEDAVKVLVNNSQTEIDPPDCTGETPLNMAACNGHLGITRLLLEKGADINNKSHYGFTPLLSAACKGKLDVALELLKLGASATVCDDDKDTALHFVRRKCSPELLKELLKGGALLGVSNTMGVTPLNGLSPQTLKLVLDESISTEPISEMERGKHMKDYIKVNFTNPFATVDHQTNSDLKNFIALSKSKKHEHLVFHPLFRSLIDMKWQVVQRLYFIKLFVFLLFVGLVSVHAFLEPTSQSMGEQLQNEDINAMWIKIILICLLVFLVSFRLLETIFRWKVNYKNLAHWTESILLILTIAYVVNSAHLTVPVLLLSWIQAFLHVSRYPLVSPLFYIFCYISKSFLKFFMFSFLLLTGFLLSFHFLFKDCDANDCVGGVFMTLSSSALKLSSMMLGELSYEAFPQNYNFNSWAPLLAFFVFFICFVLLNMMNGLAVSDTQDLRKRAEFSTIVSQGEMILSIESLINDLWWASILNKFKLFLVPNISSFQVLPSTGVCLKATPDKCIQGRRLTLGLVDEAKALSETKKPAQALVTLDELRDHLHQLRLDMDRLIAQQNHTIH